MKVYMKDKPHNFGYKHFVLCCDMGFAHRTKIYSGQKNEWANIKLSVLLFFPHFKG
jgi:hypothetical protein